MSGSALAPVVIPIVTTISLAAWLVIVFYAASHPQWRSQRREPGRRSANPALTDASPANTANPERISPGQAARIRAHPHPADPLPRRPAGTGHKIPAGHANRQPGTKGR
jgi:hypothetical protein